MLHVCISKLTKTASTTAKTIITCRYLLEQYTKINKFIRKKSMYYLYTCVNVLLLLDWKARSDISTASDVDCNLLVENLLVKSTKRLIEKLQIEMLIKL